MVDGAYEILFTVTRAPCTPFFPTKYIPFAKFVFVAATSSTIATVLRNQHKVSFDICWLLLLFFFSFIWCLCLCSMMLMLLMCLLHESNMICFLSTYLYVKNGSISKDWNSGRLRLHMENPFVFGIQIIFRYYIVTFAHFSPSSSLSLIDFCILQNMQTITCFFFSLKANSKSNDYYCYLFSN